MTDDELRDEFAGRAMLALLPLYRGDDTDHLACMSYNVAVAMMRERKRRHDVERQRKQPRALPPAYRDKSDGLSS